MRARRTIPIPAEVYEKGDEANDAGPNNYQKDDHGGSCPIAA